MKETKTIFISRETHSRIKDYCKQSGFNIQGWTDRILREALNKLNNK